MRDNYLVEVLENRRLLSAGALDPYFGSDGSVSVSRDTVDTRQLLTMHDGRIIIISDPTISSTRTGNFNRYKPDGSLDTFDVQQFPSSASIGNPSLPHTHPAVLDANDRLFVAFDGHVYCILPSGQLDAHFGAAGMVNSPFLGRIDGLAVQADGDILIYGEQQITVHTEQQGDRYSSAAGICRITPFGKRDLTFGPKGVQYLTDFAQDGEFIEAEIEYRDVISLAIDSTGRIIVDLKSASIEDEGPFSQDTFSYTIIRLNPDGSRDSSFLAGQTTYTFTDFLNYDQGEITSERITGSTIPVALAVDGKNRTVVQLQDINPDDPAHDAILRLNSDGTPDASFASNGLLDTFLNAQHPELRSFVVLPDNKIDVAAVIPSTDGMGHDTSDHYLIQLNEGGSLDSAFADNGVLSLGKLRNVQNLALASDGTVVSEDSIADANHTALPTQELRRLFTNDAPVPSLTLRNITTATTRPGTLDVTYRDDDPIDLSTLDNINLRINASNGFAGYGKFIGVIASSNNGALVTARYRLNAPGGAWDSADNGLYAVRLLSNQVSDVQGHFIDSQRLGTILVRVAAGASARAQSMTALVPLDVESLIEN